MANVLHIDGVAYPIGARVVNGEGIEGVITGYDAVDADGIMPIDAWFDAAGYGWSCGPNATDYRYRVTLVNPPAPTPAADPIEDEHEYDEVTV